MTDQQNCHHVRRDPIFNMEEGGKLKGFYCPDCKSFLEPIGREKHLTFKTAYAEKTKNV